MRWKDRSHPTAAPNAAGARAPLLGADFKKPKRHDQGDGTKHLPLRPIGDHRMKACCMLVHSLDDRFVVSKKSMRAFSIFVLLVRDPDGKRRALESPGETWRAFSVCVSVVRSVPSD